MWFYGLHANNCCTYVKKPMTQCSGEEIKREFLYYCGLEDKIDGIMPHITAIPVVMPYIKSRTTAQQQAEINAWVKIAVTAAEQIYRGSGRGEEKKAYVLNWLAEHGITLDEDRIDALIEAAVYELNHGVLKEGAGNE